MPIHSFLGINQLNRFIKTSLRRIFLFFPLAILLISQFLVTPSESVFAQSLPSTCSVSGVYEGDNPTVSIDRNKKYKKIEIHIGIDEGIRESLRIRIEGPGIGGIGFIENGYRNEPYIFENNAEIRVSKDRTVKVYSIDEREIIIPELNTNLKMNYGEADEWLSGTYTVSISFASSDGRSNRCQATFEIKEPEGGRQDSEYCEIELDKTNTYKNDDPVRFKVTSGVKDDSTDPNNTVWRHRVKLKADWREMENPEYTNQELFGATDENSYPAISPKTITTGLSTGGYYIEVFKHAKSLFWESEEPHCTSAFFKISPVEGERGVCEEDTVADCGFQSVKPLAQPCSTENNDPGIRDSDGNQIGKGCLKIKTALGTVDTSASGFIKWLLGFFLGLSGGIVIIIIIITGYRLMTSSGDPEKVKNAREQLTSAILGLLFIIFSLVILQFITDDILQLPGFGS